MRNNTVKIAVIGLLVFSLSACGEKHPRDSQYNSAAINAKKLCTKVLFRCLPESKETTRFKPNKKSQENNAVDKDVYQLSDKEEHQIEQREQLVVYKEITQMLDLYFPGFWGDKPEDERMEWVRQVHFKLQEYDKAYNYDAKERGSLEGMSIICAILGIDFDQKPGHEPIVAFMQNNEYADSTRLSGTINYLTFVYLKRDFTLSGKFISKWALRSALRELPRPARKVPSLDDAPNETMYHKEYDIKKIYKDTIRNGGKR